MASGYTRPSKVRYLLAVRNVSLLDHMKFYAGQKKKIIKRFLSRRLLITSFIEITLFLMHIVTPSQSAGLGLQKGISLMATLPLYAKHLSVSPKKISASA